MKTEDLQAKGLDDRSRDRLQRMAEYGKELNGIKQDWDNYKTQLTVAQTTLKVSRGRKMSRTVPDTPKHD